MINIKRKRERERKEKHNISLIDEFLIKGKDLHGFYSINICNESDNFSENNFSLSFFLCCYS